MKRKRKGLIVRADDLEIGSVVTVHHWWRPDLWDFLGSPLGVKAVNLPFIVVQNVAEPDYPPVTLDTRRCALMSVTKEFVAALKPPKTPTS